MKDHVSVANKTRQEPTRTLGDYHALVNSTRDTGNGYYIIGRRYTSRDVEMVALKMETEDSIRRGGGARRKNNNRDEMDLNVLGKSIRRTRTNVKRKILSLNADRMITCTFRENVTDINEAWKVFKYFVKLMHWRFKDFAYVAVPEYQERGAVHYHLAVHGYYHANAVRKLWQKAAGHRGGNIDIALSRKAIKKNSWNPGRIAGYLSKYITKDETVEFNRKRYSAGGEIPPPETLMGWLALGVPVFSIMGDLIKALTTRRVNYWNEHDGYFTLYYMST